MKQKDQEPKIRCFVIADDYRWHFLTDSIDEFSAKTAEYLNLMTKSQKENNYYFRNIFLTKSEFEITLKNMYQKSENLLKFKNNNDKKKPNLYLID